MLRVGFEIEVAGLSRRALREKVVPALSSRFHVSLHDDGSIRRSNYEVDRVPIIPITVGTREYLPPGVQEVDRYGPEIVTDPYGKEDILQLAGEIAEALYKVPDNPRASIHVHLSGFNTWQHIQRLLKFFYYYEAPLYRVFALGNRHRGELNYDGVPNDYRYCRPLSKPIHLMDGMKTVPLLDIEKVLGATTFGQMLAAWGRLDWFWNESGLQHYCPHRLHAVNLASLLRHRTVEIRVPNGTARFLQDTVALCIRIFELTTKKVEPHTAPMVLGSKPDINADQFSQILGMNIAHLWGHYWPKGVINESLLSHYSHHQEVPHLRESCYPCAWGDAPNMDDDE